MLKLIRWGLIILLLVAAAAYLVWFTQMNIQKVQVRYFPGRPPIEAALVSVILGTIAVTALPAYLAGLLPTSIGKARLRLRMRRSRAAIGRYREGVRSLLQKDYRRAKKRLAGVPSGDECTTVSSRMALAEVHLAEGKTDEALEVIVKAKEAAPGDLALLMLEARVHRKKGDPRKALEVLREIGIEHGPSVGVLEEERDVLVALGEWDEAYRVQRSLIEVLPDAGEEALQKEEGLLLWLRYEYARSLGVLGRDEDAEEILKALQRKKKGFAAAAIALGDLQASRGREDAAVKTWEKAYWAKPEPALLDRIEESALKTRKSDEVVKLYKSILKEWPEDLAAKLRYGRLCLKLEKAEEALAEFEGVERAGGEAAVVALLKAEACSRLKRQDQALEHFRKAVPFTGSAAYACTACRAETPRWDGACPVCKKWGTLKSLDERVVARVPAASASRDA